MGLKKITVPFDIPGYKTGDKVAFMEFMSAVSVYISQLKNEYAEIETQLGTVEEIISEKEYEIALLKDQLITIEENLRDYYKPRNKYELNGVREEDFR